MGTITDKLTYLDGTKTAIKEAIVSKGVSVSDTDTFRSYADKISSIKYRPRFISFMEYTGVDLIDELSNLDTSNVTSMREMFHHCEAIETLDLRSLVTDKVTNMSYMFDTCLSLKSVDLSSFNTSNVSYMQYMFDECEALQSVDVSMFDTSKVKYFYCMFRNCTLLTTLDISNFDTTSLLNSDYMFYNCTNLKSLIINNPKVFPLIGDDGDTGANAFTGSSIASGTGYVYVPDDLVETYKTTTNWSTYANQIKGISELGG